MHLRSEGHVGSSAGERQYKGCGLVVDRSGMKQGSADMMTREVREFQGRSWGATKKMRPISQLCLEH